MTGVKRFSGLGSVSKSPVGVAVLDGGAARPPPDRARASASDTEMTCAASTSWWTGPPGAFLAAGASLAGGGTLGAVGGAPLEGALHLQAE